MSLLTAQAAEAACSTVGTTVTCTGTTSGAFAGFDGTGIVSPSVTVVPGATLDGTTFGIFFHDGTVTNSGTISGGSTAGIYADTGGISVTNSGSVSGGAFGTFAHTDANVTNSGTISGGTAAGVYADTGGVILTNSGSVSGGAFGTFAHTDANVTNSDTITGGTVAGVFANSGNANVTNSGSISGGVFGVFAQHDADVVNSGIIAGGTNGVHANGDVSVVNSGGISGSNSGVFAVGSATVANSGSLQGATFGLYSGGVANVTNSGSISGGTFGILTGGNADVINSGSISGGTFGILTGGNANITNSGTILAPLLLGDYAILISGSGTSTLTLLPGTAIQGQILISPSTTTLNIGTGLNTALTFTPLLPTTLNTNGQPYALNGNTLAVVDPTGFAAADRFALDFAGTVADTVDARMGPLDEDAMTTGSISSAASPERRGFWITGLGFVGDRKASAPLDGFDYGAFGLMAGIDRSLSASTLAGIFGGIAHGGIKTAAGSTEVDATGGFAGAYWSKDDGRAFAHLSLTAGGFLNDSARIVANNTVTGGLETASAEYGSFFIDPALTVGLHRHVGDATVSPSLGLRYTGLYQQGYAESGSTADMTVADRTAQTLDIRGEVRADFAPIVSDAGVGRFDVRVGVDGLFSESGGVDGMVLATPMTFATHEPSSVARGFVGAGTTFTATNGTVFKADAEAGYDSANTLTLAAQASMHRAF